MLLWLVTGIEWIMEFESTCKKEKNKKLFAQRREFAPVESKLQKDIIWIVWDILLRETTGTQNMKKVMKALLDIFCIRYRSGSKKKTSLSYVFCGISFNRNQ